MAQKNVTKRQTKKEIPHYLCPHCSDQFTTFDALKAHTMAHHRVAPDTTGWGKENYPYPKGHAFIECDEMKCVGCGICQMACSMKHFGVINKELARIRVEKYLLPLPKAVQATCVQCADKERECEKACPVNPPAVYFDNVSLHMVIAEDRCLGQKCLLCQKACSAEAIRSYPAVSPKPFVCDLCDTENKGNRVPQCVNVCPYGALYFNTTVGRYGPVFLFKTSTGSKVSVYSVEDLMRKHTDEKAELIAKRLYPLTKESMGYPGWR